MIGKTMRKIMRNISKWFKIGNGEMAGKWLGKGDVRCYRPSKVGYKCNASLIDVHPVTGDNLPESEWWIFLTPTN